mmetsp:Transcript_31684/g.80422  ORF Transcript_31684/g.80422 Transcript_31684/m.80422 type:complete len:219 (-) Transcript_31684:147-803(-)
MENRGNACGGEAVDYAERRAPPHAEGLRRLHDHLFDLPPTQVHHCVHGDYPVDARVLHGRCRVHLPLDDLFLPGVVDERRCISICLRVAWVLVCAARGQEREGHPRKRHPARVPELSAGKVLDHTNLLVQLLPRARSLSLHLLFAGRVGPDCEHHPCRRGLGVLVPPEGTPMYRTALLPGILVAGLLDGSLLDIWRVAFGDGPPNTSIYLSAWTFGKS